MNNLRVKSRTELALEYGISRRTFYNWLKSENIILKSRQISPKEQLHIYDKLGKPEFS